MGTPVIVKKQDRFSLLAGIILLFLAVINGFMFLKNKRNKQVLTAECLP
jgi:hypothetical protein